MDDKKEGSSSDCPPSWKPSSTQAPQPAIRTVQDSFAPPAFNGTNVDVDTWLAHFRRYAEYRQLSEEDIVANFPVFLKDSVIDWFDTLSREVQATSEPHFLIISKLTSAKQKWIMFLLRNPSLREYNVQEKK